MMIASVTVNWIELNLNEMLLSQAYQRTSEEKIEKEGWTQEKKKKNA